MKQRLTITLSDEVLNRVDQLIDDKQVRNRSHAIESTLLKTLNPKISTAVILAGGHFKGNLHPLLKPYNNKLLMDHILEKLRLSEIHNVIICGAENNLGLKQKFPEGNNLGIKIKYIDEKILAGTAGAVLLSKNEIGTGSFLVIHGDIFADIDINNFINFHEKEDALATIAVKPSLASPQYAKVYISGNRITEFIEEGSNKGISIVNTGVYLLKREVLKLIPEGKRFFFESDIFPQLAEEGQLAGYLFQGDWEDLE